MKRLRRTLFPALVPALVLVLAVACLAAPALANDFIQRPNVPSTRDDARPATTTKKTLPKDWQNLQSAGKVVRSTKTGNSAQPGVPATPPASIQ